MTESEDFHEMEIPNDLKEQVWIENFQMQNLLASCNQMCPKKAE